jgi:cysteine-rich repeat protein
MCGDLRVFHDEKCDDGNLVAGDGCDANCDVERGYTCDGGSHTGPSKCYEECGDGLNNGYYVCDDGNHVSGDGCSSTCTLEAGW